MVDPKKLELSDDKLAYIVECFAEDMSPVLNNLKNHIFSSLSVHSLSSGVTRMART